MRSTTPRGKRHHLLLVTHHYAPEHGAPQRRWDALTPRLLDAGVEVSVLAPPPHYPSGMVIEDLPEYAPGRMSSGRHGERIVRTRFREHSPRLLSRAADQAVSAWSAVRLGVRIFRRPSLRPDVVVGTVPGIPSMFAAWVLARALGARFVVEMRDAWPDLIEPAGLLKPRRTLRGRIVGTVRAVVHRTVSRLQGHADAVVTTTETFAQVLRDRGVRGVAVVRNGTSFAPLDPAAERPDGASPDHDARPLAHRPLRAVYAGTIGRAQDLATVVEAAALVHDRARAVEVRIVGTGAEVDALQALIDELGAPVTIGGSVPHAEVRELYEWADTVVVSLKGWVPLEWTIPSKLYEVMASGRPATACVAGEAARLVTETDAGSVVPPGDPVGLADLWCGWVDDGLVPEASPVAAAWVAEHANDDVLGARYVAIIDHLVRADRHPAPERTDRHAPTDCPSCIQLRPLVPEPDDVAAPLDPGLATARPGTVR
ncbi:glycosyltransferase family 4 protein [Isoptericola jiangsuensis]|uniref:glycosyltransferase family 4 protein n=1 Tax=Isoptericola jiangsuensis TaxID=548579 RepID=UPI003AABA60D